MLKKYCDSSHEQNLLVQNLLVQVKNIKSKCNKTKQKILHSLIRIIFIQ